MDREQLVVGLLVDHLQSRLRQLAAHHHRHQAGQQEETECSDHVENADPLVIGRGEPGDEGGSAGTGKRCSGGSGGSGGSDRGTHGEGDGEGGALPRFAASQASNSARDTARTENVIFAWKTPQYSAHAPG